MAVLEIVSGYTTTGLTVRRHFDWPQRIAQEIEARQLTLVVVFLGPNDPWDLVVEGQRERVQVFQGVVIGRQGDGHPGPKALWEGLMKLMSYVEALQTVHEVYGPSATCG